MEAVGSSALERALSRCQSKERRADRLFAEYDRVSWWRWRERRRLRSQFAAACRDWLYDTSL